MRLFEERKKVFNGRVQKNRSIIPEAVEYYQIYILP